MKHAWIAKQLVVHFPEFVLPRGGLRGARGQRRCGMFPSERKMTEHETQGAAELIEVPNEQRKRPHTIQALEIRVLNESDECVRLATHVVRGIGRRREWRPTEQGRRAMLRIGLPLPGSIIR